MMMYDAHFIDYLHYNYILIWFIFIYTAFQVCLQ